jgi:hypothetical protein
MLYGCSVVVNTLVGEAANNMNLLNDLSRTRALHLVKELLEALAASETELEEERVEALLQGLLARLEDRVAEVRRVAALALSRLAVEQDKVRESWSSREAAGNRTPSRATRLSRATIACSFVTPVGGISGRTGSLSGRSVSRGPKARRPRPRRAGAPGVARRVCGQQSPTSPTASLEARLCIAVCGRYK